MADFIPSSPCSVAIQNLLDEEVEALAKKYKKQKLKLGSKWCDKSKYEKKYKKHSKLVYNTTLESVVQDFGFDQDKEIAKKIFKKRKRDGDSSDPISSKKSRKSSVKEINSSYKKFVDKTSELLGEHNHINPDKLLHLPKSHKIVNGVVITPIRSFYGKSSPKTMESQRDIPITVKPVEPGRSKASMNLETLYSVTQGAAKESDKSMSEGDNLTKNTAGTSAIKSESNKVLENCDKYFISSSEETSISMKPPPSPVLNLSDMELFNFTTPNKNTDTGTVSDCEHQNAVPDILKNIEKEPTNNTSSDASLTITNVWSISKKNEHYRIVNVDSPGQELKLIASLKKNKRESSVSNSKEAHSTNDSISNSTCNASDQPLTVAGRAPSMSPELNEYECVTPVFNTAPKPGASISEIKGSKKHGDSVLSSKISKRKEHKKLKLRIKLKKKMAKQNSKEGAKASESLANFQTLQILPKQVEVIEVDDTTTDDAEEVDVVGIPPETQIAASTTANSCEMQDEPCSKPYNNVDPPCGELDDEKTANTNSTSPKEYHLSSEESITTQSSNHYANKTQTIVIETNQTSTSSALHMFQPIVILSDVKSNLTPCQKYQLDTQNRESIPQGENEQSDTSSDPHSSKKDTMSLGKNEVLCNDNISNPFPEKNSNPVLSNKNEPSRGNNDGDLTPKEESASSAPNKRSFTEIVSDLTQKKKLRQKSANNHSKDFYKKKKNSGKTESDRRSRNFKYIRMKKLEDYTEIVLTIESVSDKKQDTKLPRQFNFLNIAALRDFTTALSICKKHRSCKAVLISSVGPFFCSGINPELLRDWTPNSDPSCDIVSHMEKLVEVLINFNKPLIGAVQGPAVGFGATILLFCDFIYASKRAMFQWPGIVMGLPPYGCTSLLLPKSVGTHRAKNLIMDGTRLTATEAKMAGLVTEVVPHDSLMKHAMVASEGIGISNTRVIQFMKQSLTPYSVESLLERNSKEAATLRDFLKSSQTHELLTVYLCVTKLHMS